MPVMPQLCACMMVTFRSEWDIFLLSQYRGKWLVGDVRSYDITYHGME